MFLLYNKILEELLVFWKSFREVTAQEQVCVLGVKVDDLKIYTKSVEFMDEIKEFLVN